MKKIMCFLLSCVLLISSSSLVFANSPSKDQKDKVIDRNTVITEKNIDDILKHYGIDPSTAIKRPSSADNTPCSTVGELEDALNILAQEPKQRTINKNLGNNDVELTTNNAVSSVASTNDISITGGVRLYTNTEMSSFWGLAHSVSAYYLITDSSSQWTNAESPYVNITGSPAPGTKFVITQCNTLLSSYTSTTVTVNSSVVVCGYVTLGVTGFEYDVKSSECTVNSNIYWGTWAIPS